MDDWDYKACKSRIHMKTQRHDFYSILLRANWVNSYLTLKFHEKRKKGLYFKQGISWDSMGGTNPLINIPYTWVTWILEESLELGPWMVEFLEETFNFVFLSMRDVYTSLTDSEWDK